MKIVVSGGGTGGHIFPAIAVADRLKERLPGVEILFVGALGKMEMERVPRAGYEIIGLPVAGLKRSLSLDNLSLPLKVMRSVNNARSILEEFKPDVVVGFGGYASGPALWAASRMKIPVVIQEQNSYAGLTNKLLARKAERICVAYSGMERFFPVDKIVVTGNPVRGDLLNLKDKREEAFKEFDLTPGKKTMLVFGGSLGARTLNEALAAATGILGKRNDIQVLWQLGKLYAERFSDSDTAKLPGVRAVEFIERMDLAYALADVVVCRAGALTISEICLVGKAAVLVPSPNVAEDHQTQNALALADREAAILVRDDVAIQNCVSEAVSLLDDEERRQSIAGSVAMLAKPHATDAIVNEVCKAAGV